MKLQKRSPLSTGRVVLYGCPECGDIDCGAITVSVLDDRIMWKDFDHETGYGGPEDLYSHVKPVEFDKQNYFDVFSRF